MKKIAMTISNFFKTIWYFIDKKIILPITKLIFSITDKFSKSGKKFEFWLSKSSVLLFISLFLAIVTFIIVDQKILVYTESSAEVLKSQPINVIYNEEAYVIEGLPETVDITLIGSKTDLYIAKQSPSYDVTVDLTGLKPGTHKVAIKYNQASKTIDYNVNPSVATVIIYPKMSETKNLTYDVLNQKALNDKLTIDSVDLETDEVTIKGAEAQLNKVATVKALIDINNLLTSDVGKNELKDIILKAYDSNGDAVDVEIVPNKISANINIASPSKQIPIKVIPTGELSFGKAINSINISESKVTVYGNKSVVDSLEYLPLEVDVDDLKEDKDFKVELDKPMGIRSLSVNNVTVKITIGNVSDKTIDDIKIEYRNLSDGYAVQAVSEQDSKVSVVAKGVESVINDLETTDIIAYLDLEGYSEGDYEIPVVIEGSDLRVQYVSKIKKVKIKIIKK